MTSNYKKTKFLSGKEIEEAVSEVARISDEQHISIVLAGGAAMQVYGSDRLTKDVDFIASEIPSLEKDREYKLLSFGGIGTTLGDGIPVDYIVRNDDFSELYEEAEAKGIDVDLPIRAVSPEYMAALKLAAGRTKDEEDLRFLIAADFFDRKLAREIIKRLLGAYAAESFDSFVYEVDWRRSQEKEKK